MIIKEKIRTEKAPNSLVMPSIVDLRYYGETCYHPLSASCLVIELDPKTNLTPVEVAQDPAFADWPLVVISDDSDRGHQD